MRTNPLTALLSLALSASFLIASPAQAQKVVSVGISGGISFPTGELADFQASGFHVGGHLNFAPASLPVELLVDLTYHGFDPNLEVPTSVNFNYFAAAVNAAYVFPGANMRPYIMGGLGEYFGKADVAGAKSESEFGFDVGAGLRFALSGLTTFLQARANFVGDNTFVPISFGVLF